MSKTDNYQKSNNDNKGILNFKIPLLFTCLLSMCFVNLTWAESNQPIKDFIGHQFAVETPAPQRVWINKDRKKEISKQINPSTLKLSYRYWQKDDKTVWILNEIGKERDITTGIVIKNNHVQKVEVLVYRESRGGQVQNPRFTQQYYQKNKQSNFTKEIDSISGATLSVNALNKQVKLAFMLNNYLAKDIKTNGDD